MIAPRSLRQLIASNRAAATIEFAILAPVIFSLMLGVLQIGLHMHDYNAIRSVASETARYTIVEFQKGNDLTDEQIETKAAAFAVNAPYLLTSDNLDVVASRPTTDITGTIKVNIQVNYTPTSLLNVIGIGAPTMTVNRPVYVDA